MEEMGCTGWSYKNVLPYFKASPPLCCAANLAQPILGAQKSEAVQLPIPRSPYRNSEGPLAVSYIQSPKPHVNSFLAGAQ